MGLFAGSVRIAVATTTAIVLVLPGASAADKLRMTIPIISVSFGPYIVAMNKGYYAEEGLDVERINAQGGIATAALLSGSTDISTSSAAALTALLRGAALKIVYTMMDRPNYQVWSTSAELKTLQDLKDKNIGVQTRGDTYEIAMRLTLQSAALSPDWVAYTPIGTGAAARATIQTGALPAVVIAKEDVQSLSDAPALQRGHLIVNTFDTIRMPYTGAAVSDKFLADHPDIIKRYLVATMKGLRYMRTFRAETNAILKKEGADLDDHTLDVNYTDVVETLTPYGEEAADVLRKDMEIRASLLNIPPDKVRSVDQAYDYRLLREANAELDKAGWKPVP
jgi:ABC-type nitrate/sulfonate/bicarbonate transport system substrate-binding protein